MTSVKYPQNPSKYRGRPKRLPQALRTHLKAIANEVTWLSHFHEVFCQFNDIVRQSPVNNEQSEFWEFMKWAFVSELVQRVDRLCENQWKQKKKRVHSLQAFLEDVLPHVDLINRENYVGARPNTLAHFKRSHPRKDDPFIPAHEFHRLNKEFSRIAGKRKFALSAAHVERDRRGLERKTKRITRYRNKQLAHMAVNRGRMKAPNLRELAEAIRLIRKMTRKYYLLVFVGSHALDFGHVDITKIFIQPWIIGTAERDLLRRAFRERESATD